MRNKNVLLTIAFTAGIIGAALLASAPFEANAIGNVLLPSDSPNDNAQIPNLGLVPRQPSPPEKQAQPGNQPPAQPPAAAAALQPFLPQFEIRKPDANAAATPTTAPPPEKSLAAELLSVISPEKSSPIPQPLSNVTNYGSTIIIKSTTPPPLPQQVQELLQRSSGNNAAKSRLTVTLSNQSVWGPSDIDKVVNKLGLPRRKVTESCIMSLRGIAATENGASTFDTRTKGKDEILYAGKINKIYADMQALCPATESVPSGKGFIHQIDDRFVVHLATGNCTPRLSVPPQEVIVTYAGNEAAQCDYK